MKIFMPLSDGFTDNPYEILEQGVLDKISQAAFEARGKKNVGRDRHFNFTIVGQGVSDYGEQVLTLADVGKAELVKVADIPPFADLHPEKVCHNPSCKDVNVVSLFPDAPVIAYHRGRFRDLTANICKTCGTVNVIGRG